MQPQYLQLPHPPQADLQHRRLRVILLGHGAAGKTRLKETILLERGNQTTGNLNASSVSSAGPLDSWSTSQSCAYLLAKGVHEDVVDVLRRKSFNGYNLDERDESALRYDLMAMLACDEDALESLEWILELIQELQIEIDENGGADGAPVEAVSLYTSTVGIMNDSFTHRIIEPATQQPIDVHVDVLDFAGQQEYFLSHSLFLKDQDAIYIVVNNAVRRVKKSKKHAKADGKNADASASTPSPSDSPASSSDDLDSSSISYQFNTSSESEIHFWLTFLQSLFPASTPLDLVLVQTHIDELRKLSVINTSGNTNRKRNPVASSSSSYDPKRLQLSLRDKYRTSYPSINVMQLDYSQPHALASAPTSMSCVRQAILSLITQKVLSTPSSPYSRSESYITNWIQTLLQMKKSFPVVTMNELYKRLRESDVQLFQNSQDQTYINHVIYTLMNCFTGTSLILPIPSLNIVLLDPAQWFSHCLAIFISCNTSDEEHRLLGHHGGIKQVESEAGVIEWHEIEKYQQQLMCRNADQLRLLMNTMVHLGLCFPLMNEAGSSASSSSSSSSHQQQLPTRFLFPALLPINPRVYDTLEAFMNCNTIEEKFNQRIKETDVERRKTVTQSVGHQQTASSSSPASSSSLPPVSSSFSISPPQFNTRSASRFIYSIVGRDWTCNGTLASSSLTRSSMPTLTDFSPTFFPNLQIRCLKHFGSVACVEYGHGYICVRSNRFEYEQGFIQLLPTLHSVRAVASGYAPQYLLSEFIELIEAAILGEQQHSPQVPQQQQQQLHQPPPASLHLTDTSITRYALCRFCLAMLCFPQRWTGPIPSDIINQFASENNITFEDANRGMYVKFAEGIDRFELGVHDARRWEEWKGKNLPSNQHVPHQQPSPSTLRILASSCWSSPSSISFHCRISHLRQDTHATIGFLTSVDETQRMFDQIQHVFYHHAKKRLYLLTNTEYHQVQITGEEKQATIACQACTFENEKDAKACAACGTALPQEVGLDEKEDELEVDEEEEEEEEEKKDPPLTPPSSWSCLACTLLNPPFTQQCRICTTYRPLEDITAERRQHEMCEREQKRKAKRDESVTIWKEDHADRVVHGDDFLPLSSHRPIFSTERSFPADYDSLLLLSDDESMRDELILLRSQHYWRKKLRNGKGKREIEFLDSAPYYPRLFATPATTVQHPSFHADWRYEIHPFLSHHPRSSLLEAAFPSIQLLSDLPLDLIQAFNLSSTSCLIESSPSAPPLILSFDANTTTTVRLLNLTQIPLPLRQEWIKNLTIRRMMNFTTSQTVNIAVKTYMYKSPTTTIAQLLESFLREVEMNLRVHQIPHENILPMLGYIVSGGGSNLHVHNLQDLLALSRSEVFLQLSQHHLELSLLFPLIPATLERVYITDRYIQAHRGGDAFMHTVNIMQQCAAAVAHLHTQHIMHCDIAPRSFLLDLSSTNPRVYLTNLACARVLPKWNELVQSKVVSEMKRASSSDAASLNDLPTSTLHHILSFLTFRDRTLRFNLIAHHFHSISSSYPASFGVLPLSTLVESNRVAPEVLTHGIYSRAADSYQFGRFLNELLSIWSHDIISDVRIPVRDMISPITNPRLKLGVNVNLQVEYSMWPRDVCDVVQACVMTSPDERWKMKEVGEHLKKLSEKLQQQSPRLSLSSHYSTPFTDFPSFTPPHTISSHIMLDRFTHLCPSRLKSSPWTQRDLPHHSLNVEAAFQHPLSKAVYLVAGENVWKLRRSVTRRNTFELCEGYPMRVPKKWKWPIGDVDENKIVPASPSSSSSSSSSSSPTPTFFTPHLYSPLSIFTVRSSIFLLKGDLLYKLSSSSVNGEDDLSLDPDARYPMLVSHWYTKWRRQHIAVTKMRDVTKLVRAASGMSGSSTYTSPTSPDLSLYSSSRSLSSTAASSSVLIPSTPPLTQHYLLADCYLFQRGHCNYNLTRALDIYRILSREYDHAHSWYRLGVVHSRKLLLAASDSAGELTPLQETQTRVITCFVRAAHLGSLAALAWVHTYGWSTFVRDEQLARNYAYLAVASMPNDPVAHVFLAAIIQQGGSAEDLASAMVHYERALALGDDFAIEPLSLLLISIHPPDINRAMHLISSLTDASRRAKANRSLLDLLDAIRTHGTKRKKAWSCSMCTYLNPASRDTCEMCGAVYDEQQQEQDSKQEELEEEEKNDAGTKKLIDYPKVPITSQLLQQLECESGLISYEATRVLLSNYSETSFIIDPASSSSSSLPLSSAHSYPHGLSASSPAAEFDLLHMKLFDENTAVTFYSYGSTDPSNATSTSLPIYSWAPPYELKTFAYRHAEELAFYESIELSRDLLTLQTLIPSHHRVSSSDLTTLSKLGAGISSNVHRAMYVGMKYKGAIFAVKTFLMHTTPPVSVEQQEDANKTTLLERASSSSHPASPPQIIRQASSTTSSTSASSISQSQSQTLLNGSPHLTRKELLSHFQHELQIYLDLPKHPHILDFFGVVFESNLVTNSSQLQDLAASASPTSAKMQLILQYMSRTSLSQVLSDPNGGLSLSWPNPNTENLIRLVSVLRECASSLAFLHSRGLIHCDVAPRNFLLDGNYSVRICDFGLARYLPKNPSYDPKVPKRGIEEYARMGVRSGGANELLPRQIMSPECLQPSSINSPSADSSSSASAAVTPYSRACDIWSFGCMIWQCFNGGRPPWNSRDFPELVHASPVVREQRIVTLIARGHLRLESSPHWPVGIQQILTKCFDANPKQRETQASMARLTEQLSKIEEELRGDPSSTGT